MRRVALAAQLPADVVRAITAHGLRGTWSSTAQRLGVTPDLVAAELGHDDPRTTRESYTDPSAALQAQAERVAAVLRAPELVTIERPIVTNPTEETKNGGKAAEYLELIGIEPTASRVRFCPDYPCFIN